MNEFSPLDCHFIGLFLISILWFSFVFFNELVDVEDEGGFSQSPILQKNSLPTVSLSLNLPQEIRPILHLPLPYPQIILCNHLLRLPPLLLLLLQVLTQSLLSIHYPLLLLVQTHLNIRQTLLSPISHLLQPLSQSPLRLLLQKEALLSLF